MPIRGFRVPVRDLRFQIVDPLLSTPNLNKVSAINDGGDQPEFGPFNALNGFSTGAQSFEFGVSDIRINSAKTSERAEAAV